MSKRLTSSALVATLAMAATAIFTSIRHEHVETVSLLAGRLTQFS